ncbi:MAG: hypothetical protein JOZ99_15715 [Actinobacteria bacterium]|nr:hypothetical protein [Actinomycetota bacterium]
MVASLCETSGRTLHLVDLENLIGDARAASSTALQVFERYLALAEWRDGDLVYVATNPALASRIVWDLRVPCHRATACGPDGADRALLNVVSPDFVARRVERLVIGSGDHIFIQRALQVRELGTGVAVVSRPASLHSGWRAHGFPVIQLGGHDDVATPARRAA